MTDTAPTTPERPSGKKILIGSSIALAVAAVGLVVFVLPAEYGIDPTGAGTALGVTKLSAPAEEENIYLKRGQARTNVLFPVEPSPEDGRFAVRDVFTEKGVDYPADAPLNSDRFTIELAGYEAIELAGTGKANPGSLLTAIDTATQMAQSAGRS